MRGTIGRVLGRLAAAASLAACASGTAPSVIDVPPPATARADRLGLYAWGFDDSAWPGVPDRLSWATGQIGALGSHVARVALGPDDPYQVNGGATALADIAQQPAYAALWSDARWTTILVTAYSAADQTSPWQAGYAHDDAAAERDEIAALAEYLQTFPGKQFVILPWEGDNAIAPFETDPAAWEGYAGWIEARRDGVVDARTKNPDAPGAVYSGLEFNAVRRLDDGSPCDGDAHRCIVSYVAPRVPVDYYSYSAWQSLADDVDSHDIETQLRGDLDSALALVRGGRPDATAANLIVGELGSARDDAAGDECVAAIRTQAAADAADGYGVSFAIDWQIIDNAAASGTYTGFGAFKYDMSRSLAGDSLAATLAGATPTTPQSCPTIGAGGVVNGLTFDGDIHPGDALSIFGTGFAASGNIVHVKQMGTEYTVQVGSPAWYESSTQINFTLPAGVIAGQGVRVYVSSGHDSNGQLIDVL